MSVVVGDGLILDQKLCGYEFTLGWLLNSLKNDKEFHENFDQKILKSFDAKDISVGKGFFSTVLKIVLEFENDEKYSTILKIPGTESWDNANSDIMNEGEEKKIGERNLVDVIIQMHETECDFYEYLSEYIPEILPKVFHSQKWIKNEQLGCFHMEDLSIRCKNLNFTETLTIPQFKNVIDWLAYFHSKLFVNDEWKGKFTKQTKFFTYTAGIFEAVIPKIVSVLKNGKNDVVRELENEKFKKIVSNQKFIDYAFLESYKDHNLPALLTHADLWASNIMFKKCEKGNISENVGALLDWQVANEGNFLFDFVRLMQISLDGDVRRQMENEIFDFYIDQLNGYLENLGKEKVKFTAEQLKEAYEVLFLTHAVHPLLMLNAIANASTDHADQPRVAAAKFDKCVLRSLHTLEDANRILETGKFDKWL
uniref:CHK kinase-like domain-containing protein n=1 Tax=Panagrolaimus sp. JU765 TaxID=591449 RepID=A0AC34RAT8_9BILA